MLADERLIRSAHDCSDGGLAVTLAECCFGTGGIGAEVSIEARDRRTRQQAERRGGALRRVGVARRRVGAPDNVTEVLAAGGAAGVPRG